MVTAYNAPIAYNSPINYNGGTPIVTAKILPTLALRVRSKAGVVSPLPEAQVDSVSFEDSAVSACSVSVESTTVGASLLGDYSILEMTMNGALVQDGRWIVRGQNWNAGLKSQVKQFTGRHLLWDRLERARVWNDRRYLYAAKTPGFILNDLFIAAQARGVGYWGNFTWSFNATYDSAGRAWPAAIGSIEYLPTAKYSDIVLNLVDKGVIEIHLLGDEIQAYVPDTFGRVTDSLLVVGEDVVSAPQQSSTDSIVSDVIMVGDDAVTVTRSNPATSATYWREEDGISQGGTSDIGTLSVFGDVALSKGDGPRVQRTYELVITQERPYLPIRNYIVGDWVRVQHGDEAVASYRAKQIVLKSTNGQWTGSLVLNDKFIENELRLVKKVDAIIGGAVITGSTQTAPPDDVKDTSKPLPPTSPVTNTTVYTDSVGQTKVAAAVQYSAPLLNVDGTTFTDPGDYRLGWRYSDELSTAWRYVRNDQPLWYLSPLEPNRSVTILAQTIDSSGNASVYSPASSFTTANDTIAPNKPSDPILTSVLKTISAYWDGKDDFNALMPTDFKNLEVWSSASNGFTDTTLGALLHGSMTQPGNFYITSHPYAIGQTVYVRFIAVDISGNRSVISDIVSITVQGVTGPDITAGTITANNLAVGSVTAQAIFAGAITADKIALGQTQNLVQDPSFNNTDWCTRRLTTAWTEKPSRWAFKKFGDINWDLIQRNGAYLQALSQADGVNGGRMYITDWIYTQLGESYYAAMYMRNGEFAPNAEATMALGVEVVAKDGAILSDAIKYAPFSTWTKYGFKFVISNPNWVKVRFFIRADDLNTGDLAVDDLEVRGGVGTTAYAGSRGLIDPLGLFAYDSDDLETVAIDFRTGDVTVRGTITSGFTGKRVVVNPGSTYLPEIRFYPTTGDDYGYINSSDSGLYPFIGVNAPDIGGSSQAMILYDDAFLIGELNKTTGLLAGAGVLGNGTGIGAYIALYGKFGSAASGGESISSYVFKNLTASGSAFAVVMTKPPPAWSGQWILIYSVRKSDGQRHSHMVTSTTSTTETISFYTNVSAGVDTPAFSAVKFEIRHLWIRSDGDA